MRKLILIASIAAAMAACGQPAATPSEAQAQTNGPAASAEVSAAERTAIMASWNIQGDGTQPIENECGERVVPQFFAADLGPGVGRAVLFVMTGGPNTISCYGDGPMVQLMRNDGSTWREIYQNRGGDMIILPTMHNNANDLADGGPGFSFPVWQWNGSEYEDANRQVPDSALSEARFLPN